MHGRPRIQRLLPVFGQLVHEPIPHPRGDVRVASLHRAILVSHPFIHEFGRGPEFLHDCLMGMPEPVRSETPCDRQPARVGTARSIPAPRRQTWPRVRHHRYRARLLRGLLRVPPRRGRMEQPGGETRPPPVRRSLCRLTGTDVAKFRDGLLHPGARFPRDCAWTIQHIRHRRGGDVGAAGYVHQLRADMPRSTISGTVATEDVGEFVARARGRLGPGDMPCN